MLDDDDQLREVMNANAGRIWKTYRWWLVVVAVVAVGFIGSLVVHFAESGTHQVVDQAKLEQQIHTWAVEKERASPSVKVSCPGDQPQKADTTFHCVLSGGGQSVRLTVTVENDQGYLTWVTG
jgi:hypothetical protein